MKLSLPIKLPIGIEHSVERFHKEVASPDIHFIDTRVSCLVIYGMEKETVCLRNILGKIAVDKRIHGFVAGTDVNGAERIVLVHVLDSLKNTAERDSRGAGVLGLAVTVLVYEIPVGNIVLGKVVEIEIRGDRLQPL